MFTGADQYLSYGFLPFTVEADVANQTCRIIIDDPRMAYPEFDRWGTCVSYFKRYVKTAG
jgi:hypothetical protein